MQKQREQCEIVGENAQAFVVTDAKARQGHLEAARADEATNGTVVMKPEVTPSEAAPQNQRPKRRSAGELKALMEKKRDECHVLESAQEHVNTDAKATGGFLKPSPKNSVANRCGTSSKELQHLMSRLRDQCEISEGPTPEFVATDAKASVRPASSLSSQNKENIGYMCG